MKKILLPLLLVVALFLAACGNSSTASTQTAAAAETPTLSLATELVVGTLKLEGTDNAVTAEQAVTLLPLWQAYQSLSQGDTTAQEELDGLARQIKSAMTAEQVSAIEAMNLTQQDIFTVMQAQGITNGPSASGTPDVQVPGNNGNFNPGGTNGAGGPPSGGAMPSGGMPSGGMPSGGMPSGGMPSGGAAPGGDQGTGQMMQGTPQANQPQVTGITNRVPTALVNALIELLKSK